MSRRDTSFILIFPQCIYCRHFRTLNRRAETCGAYPDGIPDGILTNTYDHREAFPGDHGVRFDPIDEDAARTVAAIFAPPAEEQ